MTPDEINKAIAEHLGWQFLPERDTRLGPQPELWEDPDGERYFETPLSNWPPYPNFCEDLNAMHEAEQSLTPKQRWEFTLRLVTMQENSTLTQPEDWSKLIDAKFKAPGFFAAVFASAAQRAEAFLKTIGKWKE